LSDQDDRRAAAQRLAGDAQVQMGQSQQALDSLLLARSLSSGVVHQALTALSTSAALNEVGNYSDSAYQAGWAASHLSGRGFLIERMQASRLLAESRRRSGDIEGAVRAVKGAVGVGLSSRWIRQYVRFGAASRDNSSALYLRGGPALLEIIRLNLLEAELQLDLRTDGITAEATDDLDECIDSFHLLGSSLDAETWPHACRAKSACSAVRTGARTSPPGLPSCTPYETRVGRRRRCSDVTPCAPSRGNRALRI
jgi:hypothetical protein